MTAFLSALGLALILEGILPMIAPTRWQALMTHLAEADPRQIRATGAIIILGGSLLMLL